MIPEMSPLDNEYQILPEVALMNKLSFNGFHVTFWDHEMRIIDEKSFPDTKSIENRGIQDGFPNVRDFVDGLYDSFGDCVGMVKDNLGIVIYDNMKAMHKWSDEDYF